MNWKQMTKAQRKQEMARRRQVAANRKSNGGGLSVLVKIEALRAELEQQCHQQENTISQIEGSLSLAKLELEKMQETKNRLWPQ